MERGRVTPAPFPMKKIKVVRQFRHADGIYPVTIIPGLYAIEGNNSMPEQKKVSVECAEIALMEGWAVGHQCPKCGPEKPSASSQADPQRKKKTRKKSKVKRKS